MEVSLSQGEKSLDRALATADAATKGGSAGTDASKSWAMAIVKKGSLLLRTGGKESVYMKVGVGSWFVPGRVTAVYAIEETSLCLVDSASFEKVVSSSPYLLYYIKNSGVLL